METTTAFTLFPVVLYLDLETLENLQDICDSQGCEDINHAATVCINGVANQLFPEDEDI